MKRQVLLPNPVLLTLSQKILAAEKNKPQVLMFNHLKIPENPQRKIGIGKGIGMALKGGLTTDKDQQELKMAMKDSLNQGVKWNTNPMITLEGVTLNKTIVRRSGRLPVEGDSAEGLKQGRKSVRKLKHSIHERNLEVGTRPTTLATIERGLPHRTCAILTMELAKPVVGTTENLRDIERNLEDMASPQITRLASTNLTVIEGSLPPNRKKTLV